MTEILAQLEQRATFKGYRSFVIQNDGKVVATYCSPGSRQEITHDLAALRPNMTREKHLATEMIAGMCIFAVPALGFLGATFTTSFGTSAFFWFSGIFLVFLLPLGLCWREYVVRSYDLLEFLEPMTGNRLILFRSVPNQAAVNAFVGTLQQAIRKAREAADVGATRGRGTLSDELERLAALRDRGVLTDSEFQQAKTALLASLERKRDIGFHA
jgi:hypothetical protein